MSAIITVNTGFGNYIKGQKVPVQTDEKGTPLARFWRDKLKDASSEREQNPDCAGCVTLVIEEKKAPKTIKKTEVKPEAAPEVKE